MIEAKKIESNSVLKMSLKKQAFIGGILEIDIYLAVCGKNT